ncbi:DNA binding domain-containing protein, excisionase family [Modestobacter sp. DSM 44400]|uniref:helix-turn-helix domain-containing protein n=1 Tax=Modestobacter sp. DSM 44400 TaxID=1550230 RepID=UPI000896A427|nr:helix-turn-helix domain-containing protein [Modestobacter sp. DSM 44400]SDY95886.1 DNA binding domain-containing protein, excisionase family [Modestobacter sp. DSM 44400]
MGDPERLRDVLNGDSLLLTPEEAAKLLRLGRTTVYALMKAGELHPVHIGAQLSTFPRRSRALRQPARDSPAEPCAPPRPRRRGRTTTNQRGLFELSSDPVDRG